MLHSVTISVTFLVDSDFLLYNTNNIYYAQQYYVQYTSIQLLCTPCAHNSLEMRVIVVDSYDSGESSSCSIDCCYHKVVEDAGF